MPFKLSSKTSRSSSNETTALRSFYASGLRRAAMLLFASGIFFLISPTLSHAQSIQYTHNKPDQALRSAMRVDPSTLGLSIEVPIAGYPGRGGASLPINLSYSSKQWRIDFFSSYLTVLENVRTVSYPKFSEFAKASWTSSADVPRVDWNGGVQPFNSDGTPYGGEGSPLYINRLRIHMPGGSSHELRMDDTPSEKQTVVGTFYAFDSSNLRYESTSFYDGILYLPDGSRYVLTETDCQYIDRNGNTLSYNAANRQWTDTQSRVLDVPLHPSPSATTYTYNLPSTTSTPMSYGVRWSTLQNALTNTSDALCYVSNMTPDNTQPGDLTIPRSPALFYGDQADRVYGEAEKFNPMVLAEIILPNGQHYLFTYNVWGEITKVIYPTGAYERFDHEVVVGVGFLQAPYAQTNRGVVDRYLSPSGNGGDELHWHYAAAASSNVLTVSTTAPAPFDTLTKRLMSAETSSQSNYFGFSNPGLGTSFEEHIKSPGGTMLRRTLTNWALAVGPTGMPRNPRVTKQVNLLMDTGTSNALTSTTTMSYDDDLNVTATDQYDFTSISQSSAETIAIGSISAGSLLRTEEATYLVNDTAISSTTRDAYRARNLLSLPTSTRVRTPPPSATIVAQTRISYDETTTYPLLTYSGTINGWSDPGNLRGLPTTAGSWLSGTTYLDIHAQFDQFGNVRNIWDANGKQSQKSYADTYGYAYPTTSTTSVPDPNGVYGSTVAFSTTAVYNANTGLMTSLTDPNGQTTSYAYDALNRPATITRPSGGGSTSYAYGDTPGNLFVRTQTSLDSSRVVEAYQFYDKLGRANRSFVNEGGTYLTTDNVYTSTGKVWKISNPYRTTSLTADVNPGDKWSTNGYDYLGRVASVTTSDGSVASSAYSLSTSTPLGPVVTATDQAGKLRRTLMDGLGRLARVDEPDNSSTTGSLGTVASPEQATSYSYDLMGNLLTVTQGSQTRTFVYDPLSRLRSVTNPESGTICYGTVVSDQCQADGYDANGNLIHKTDARLVVSTYDYDALNRNTRIVYTNDPLSTPTVSRYYDGYRDQTNYSIPNSKGRLWLTETTGETGSRTTINSYDALGNPTSQSQRFYYNSAWSEPFTVGATYGLSGQVVTQNYPSGRTTSYTYDDAGRTSSFAGKLGDNVQRTYTSEITYSPFGGMSKEKFGTDTAVYNKLLYNPRGQLAEIRESTTSATDTSWDRGAIINHYSNQGGCWGADCNATDNNGNLQRQEVYIPRLSNPTTQHDNFAQFYDYDSLSRLQAARETFNGSAAQWQQTNVYDRFGNRTINTTSETFGSGINNKAFTVNTDNKNRLGVPSGQTGSMEYDDAGNLTNDTYTGVGSYDYDAENRLKTITPPPTCYPDGEGGQTCYPGAGSPTEYVYDGDGRRVRRILSGVMGPYEIWQVYGLAGELLAEYEADAAPATTKNENGYRNGSILVVGQKNAGNLNVQWLVTDQLGTPRMVFDKTGSLAGVRRHDYLPFGEDIATVGGRTTTMGYNVPDGVRQQFTSYERDNETGLDFAQARYYGSAQGRFTSSDPLIASAVTVDPKTWNRYAYVLNNPLQFTDPTGLGTCTDASCSGNEDEVKKSRAELDYEQRLQNTRDGIAASDALRLGHYGRLASIANSNSNIGLMVDGTELWGELGAAFINGYDAARSNAMVASRDPWTALDLGMRALVSAGWKAVVRTLSKMRGPDFQLVNVNMVAGITRFIARGDDMSDALQGVSAGQEAQLSYAAGWMIQRATPDRREIREWGKGLSVNVDAFFIAGGGIMRTTSSSTRGVYVGVGAGIGWGASFQYEVR